MIDERFAADVWRPSLETYGRVTHLTVALYDAEGRMACGPFNPTPLFDTLSASARDPGFFMECVRRCLRSETPELPVVEIRFGLAVVGAPVVVNGEIIAAVAAGYHLSAFPQTVSLERLARESNIPGQRLWDLARQEMPVSPKRLASHGELLHVLAETVLREHERTREHAELSARLQAADAAKDQFLAMVSHELRGPLHAMLGWTRLLRTEHLGEAAREHALETIERNGVAQTRLVEDLLDISRIVAGRMPSSHEPIELASLIEAAIQDVVPSAQAKQIRVERQFQAGATITGDSAQLHQAVANVLSNAVKFSSTGGTITVGVTRSDAYATVSIRDTGEGITPEFLPHIFEPFRQQDSSSTRVHGGLGLGLTIARHLVALHGGSTRAESPGVGHGTTFMLSLPLSTGQPNASTFAPWQPASLALEDGTPAPAVPPHLRVLVIDDEHDARELLRAVLVEAGMTVTAVASATEALAAFTQEQPHLVISDIGLPDEDGYVLIQSMRAGDSGHGTHTPAIALTAYAGDADRNRAIAAGYDVHLSKPIEFSRLLHTIAVLMQSPGTVVRLSDHKKRTADGADVSP